MQTYNLHLNSFKSFYDFLANSQVIEIKNRFPKINFIIMQYTFN
jgi:hypothetical protein